MSNRTWTIRGGTDLGRAVADIRTVTGRTQADLADDTGLTRSYVAKIETGRSSPLLDHLLRALRRMGATVIVTFDDPDPHPHGPVRPETETGQRR
jgi:transcriptional regulator with XRE-family HTH domain